MTRTLLVAWATLILAAASAQTLPRLEGDSLSGKKLVLPDQAAGHTALIIIGFTKASDKVCSEWGKRFAADFGSNPNTVAYSVAVLESAPRLVRGMITSSMRRGMPTDRQDRFLILVHGESELKKFVDYTGVDDAYLLLLDPKGAVQWRGHGAFSEQNYAPLHQAAAAR